MRPNLLGQVKSIVLKDLRRELRTREITTTTVSFSIMLLVLFAFGFYRSDMNITPYVYPGILWVSILFTGTLAITRAFDVERQGGCLRALGLIPGSENSLFIAKFLVNLLFIAVFEVVLIPLLSLMFDVQLAGRYPELAALVVGVSIGFSAMGTLVAAMMVHSQMRDVMLPILLYPMAIPLFIGGVKATSMLLMGAPSEDVFGWIQAIAAGDLIYVLMAWGLFRWVLSAIE
jgi:heme exporter protein B